MRDRERKSQRKKRETHTERETHTHRGRESDIERKRENAFTSLFNLDFQRKNWLLKRLKEQASEWVGRQLLKGIPIVGIPLATV